MSPPSDGKPKRVRVRTQTQKENSKERRLFVTAKRREDEKAKSEAVIEARGARRAGLDFQRESFLANLVAKATAESKQTAANTCIQAGQIAANTCIQAGQTAANTCIQADKVLAKTVATISQQEDTPKVDADPLLVPVQRSAKTDDTDIKLNEHKELDSTTDETPTIPSSTSTPSLASDTSTDTDVGSGPGRVILPVITIEMCPPQCDREIFQRAIDYHDNFVQECRDSDYSKSQILWMLLEFGECSSQMISELNDDKHSTGSNSLKKEFETIAYTINVYSKQVKHSNRLSEDTQDIISKYYSGMVGILQLSTEEASDLKQSIQECAKKSPTTRARDFKNRRHRTPSNKRRRNSGGDYHQNDRTHELEREVSFLRQTLDQERQIHDQERHRSASLQARLDNWEHHRPAFQSRGSGNNNYSARGNDFREHMTPRTLDYRTPNQNHRRYQHYSQSHGSSDNSNNDYREEHHPHNGRDDRDDQRGGYGRRR